VTKERLPQHSLWKAKKPWRGGGDIKSRCAFDGRRKQRHNIEKDSPEKRRNIAKNRKKDKRRDANFEGTTVKSSREGKNEWWGKFPRGAKGSQFMGG